MAGVSERLIDVGMSYSDLKIICDLIDIERNRRAGEQDEKIAEIVEKGWIE